MQADPNITYLNDNAVDFSLNKQNGSGYDDQVNPPSIDEVSSMLGRKSAYDSLNLKTHQEICNNCTYWKIHPGGYPNQHKSCICELFGNQSICCLEGYSNLMWHVPYMILYAPTPNKYIYHTVDPYTFPIQIKKNHILEIVNLASNLKSNIIPTLSFPYKKQTFVVNNAE